MMNEHIGLFRSYSRDAGNSLNRLRDLLSYAVSESYFAVRRHLGFHVREEATA